MNNDISEKSKALFKLWSDLEDISQRLWEICESEFLDIVMEKTEKEYRTSQSRNYWNDVVISKPKE